MLWLLIKGSKSATLGGRASSLEAGLVCITAFFDNSGVKASCEDASPLVPHQLLARLARFCLGGVAGVKC